MMAERFLKGAVNKVLSELTAAEGSDDDFMSDTNGAVQRKR